MGVRIQMVGAEVSHPARGGIFVPLLPRRRKTDFLCRQGVVCRPSYRQGMDGRYRSSVLDKTWVSHPFQDDAFPISLPAAFSSPREHRNEAAADRRDRELAVKEGSGQGPCAPTPSPGLLLLAFPGKESYRGRGYRPVINLSGLNKFAVCLHFKMETAWSVRQAVRSGDWSFSLDLPDAYLTFRCGGNRKTSSV